MRIAIFFFAFSITLVMVELSDATMSGTGIKPASFRSPVLVSQTKLGSRSSTLKKVFSGHLVHRYHFSSAPVYRQGYPLYRYYVAFRNDRAARISYEEQKLLDAGGNLCLGESAEKRTLEEGIDDNLVRFTYTVRINNGWVMTFPTRIDSTFSVQDEKTKVLKVTTRARYDTPVVAGTNCTQVEETAKFILVKMLNK